MTTKQSQTGSKPYPTGLRAFDDAQIQGRNAICGYFIGSSKGLPLPETSNLLGIKNLIVHLKNVEATFDAPSKKMVPVAIETANSSSRAVLAIPLDLAHLLVDMTCGTPYKKRHQRLSSGEQGALLFALEYLGSDWLDAGGRAFVIRSLLADEDQISDYLKSPAWLIKGHLKGDPFDNEIELWVGEKSIPVPKKRAAAWVDLELPVLLGLGVGWTKIDSSSLDNLAPTDLLMLDHWDQQNLELRCGNWVRTVMQLDPQSFKVVNQKDHSDLKGIKMETRVNLSRPSANDSESLEVLVRVEVGQIKMTVGQAGTLVPGQVLKLDRAVDAKVCLMVGDKQIGSGHLVDNNGEMAVEITEVP